MDLRSLRHFVAVAETLSFSRAAEMLRRSQPGLSRSIKEMEAEFGLELFERVGRRVVLSPEGERLLGMTRSLLKDADRLLSQAKLLASGKIAILRVGGASNTLERVMPKILWLYRKNWNNVEVQLKTEGGSALLSSVERGELDVAIARTTNSEFLQSKVVFPIHVVAILGRKHQLAKKNSLTAQDLDGERLLVPPPSFTSRMLLDSAFNAVGGQPNIVLESHDLHTLVALAEAEQGIALTPATVDTIGHRVKVLPIFHAGGPLGSSVALVWERRRELPPHIVAFIDVAARYLKREFPGKNLRLPPLRPYKASADMSY
jgi:DNA-binding transcriptional LysR family regulator